MEEIIKLINELKIPFYKDLGFWIGVLVGLTSVIFSYIAYREAKKAKEAAKEAGKSVKIQTITIELTELIQRLDKLDVEISYQEARDLYNEINRKVRRILSPYKKEEYFETEILEIITTLNDLKKGLNGVKPFSNDNTEEQMTGSSVYFGIESEFSTLSGQLAELSGLMEQKNIG